MDFPQFENINEDNNDQNFNHGNFAGDEIQIENMEFNNNNYQNFNENYNPNVFQNNNFNDMPWNNAVVSEMNYGNSAADCGLDEVERKRIEERKAEEDQRREKIRKKMNDELRIKQEWRDKSREYIDNWRR